MLVPLALGIATVVALLLLDRWLSRRWSPTDEPALVRSAHVLCLFLLAGSLVRGCWHGEDLAADLTWLTTFAAAGWLGLRLAETIGLTVLPGLRTAARDGNPAAALTAACHVAAIGILLANVCGGSSATELAVAAGSFAVGQATLLVLVVLFRLLTSYDDRAEVVGGNLAAAISHGGLTIALALLVAHATDGPFVGVVDSLREFGVALAEGLVVYPVRQLVVQGLVLGCRPTLSGGELDRRIGERGDVGAASMEAATYLGGVLLLRSLA